MSCMVSVPVDQFVHSCSFQTVTLIPFLTKFITKMLGFELKHILYQLPLVINVRVHGKVRSLRVFLCLTVRHYMVGRSAEHNGGCYGA